MEFGNGEFSGPELKKIMVSKKLVEIAMVDLKRAVIEFSTCYIIMLIQMVNLT